MTPASLVGAGAAIILLLGLLHLAYTFFGPKLRPRDAALQAAMQQVSPQISRQTTMWRAWVGFNASHSLGAILFGLLYLQLALADAARLFGSGFLCTLGLAVLASYLLLGWYFWFSVPLRGIALAAVLFGTGVGWHHLG